MARLIKKKHEIGFDSIIDECLYYGDYVLTNDDKKKLKKIFLIFHSIH